MLRLDDGMAASNELGGNPPGEFRRDLRDAPTFEFDDQGTMNEGETPDDITTRYQRQNEDKESITAEDSLDTGASHDGEESFSE